MLTVEDALARILATVSPIASEHVSLWEAHGRFAAEDIVSPINVPPWDNSAMDGYAVRANDTHNDTVHLVVNEVIAAGSSPTCTVMPGSASCIMTGAPIPRGADAVAIVERTDGAQEGSVAITGRSNAGDNIRRAGQDIAEGSRVIREGERLTPARLGLLSSLGLDGVRVRRRPVVGILSTGDELVTPGQVLGPGQIYSSNNIALAGLVKELGGIPRDFGTAPDRLADLMARMEAAGTCDVVVTTGGVSVGSYDLVKEAFEQLGVKMSFWKVRMKPGKPLAFGVMKRHDRAVPLFGLPGNPVSCMVNFYQYVRPWILKALGAKRPFLPIVSAVADETFTQRPGREQLIRVCLERTETHWTCRSTGSQSSGVLSSMAQAHGFLLMSNETASIEAGTRVNVQLTSTAFLNGVVPGYRWT